MKRCTVYGIPAWLLLAAVLALFALASCGQAEDGIEGAGGPVVANPTYDADIAPMLAANGCATCHNLAAPASTCSGCHPAVDLVTRVPSDPYMTELAYLDINGAASKSMTGGEKIVDTTAAASTLYWVVTDSASFTFTATGTKAMVTAFMVLPLSDQQTIKNWIDQGAPEN